MPTSIPRQDGWSLFAHTPIHFGFPSSSGGSAPARCFRGLLDVYACSGLQARQVAKRPSTSEAPTVSLPPLSLRLLPGGANQFPGGDSHSTVDQRLFHGARNLGLARRSARTCRGRTTRERRLPFCSVRPGSHGKEKTTVLIRDRARPSAIVQAGRSRGKRLPPWRGVAPHCHQWKFPAEVHSDQPDG